MALDPQRDWSRVDPLALVSERSAQDVFLGRLPLRLGGRVHVLPVLTIGQAAEWQAALDAALAPLLDDQATTVELLTALANVDMLGFIYSYDRSGVLPPREKLEPDIYPQELLRSVQEVRLAANPTLAYSIALQVDEVRERLANREPPPNRAQRRSRRTSSSQRNTAGRTARSGTT